jgi:hypothetical protein
MTAVAMLRLSPLSIAATMRSHAASNSASNSFQRGGVTGVLMKFQYSKVQQHGGK